MIPLDTIQHITLNELANSKKQINWLYIIVGVILIGAIVYSIFKPNANENIKAE